MCRSQDEIPGSDALEGVEGVGPLGLVDIAGDESLRLRVAVLDEVDVEFVRVGAAISRLSKRRRPEPPA